MHKHNIIKLLRLQGKRIKFDKEVIDEENNIVYFYIHKDIVEHSCPCCKQKTKRIKDHRYQKIKHIPINGFKTYLVLKKTRLLCTNCGKSFDMDYSDIVNKRFRSSNALFFKIIDDLKSSNSFKDISKANFVSIGVIIRYLLLWSYLMQWENITTLPKHIGIDEFKGNCDGSKYLFHIYDLDTGETIHILKSRSFNDIVNFFNNITNRNQVELVTMDLYSPFKNAVRAKLKKAIIIADRFHYTRIVANALDTLRLRIWHNSNGPEKKYFKNLKKKLLKNLELVQKDKLQKHEDALNYAFDIDGDLKYGYQLYQKFLKIKDADTYIQKVKLFRDWLDDAQSCTISEFKSAANTLLLWNKEIVNSFKYSYTNSSVEGKNNKIKVIKRIAYGFRKLSTFRARIKICDCKV